MTLDRPGRAILPLPADVVAQIKSATAVVSLVGVVLELLKNSLDAQASKVEATVDFARGACTVQDDGLGIAPLEFTEDGGLGKLYHTSKHSTREALLGRNGTFLASLSAVSLLSVTSRHHRHRSHNSVTYHHARAVERQMPAPTHIELPGEHGTRVAVRNLFGNQPVRVKQRSRLIEDTTEHGRLWTSLKTNVTGLLLSWGGRVSLRFRDAENHLVFSFNTADRVQTAEDHVPEPPSTRLNHILSVLTQADCVSVDDWASWVPASASINTISISGAISLSPAPTKRIQFISLGVRPLMPELEHNELYSQINRLFRLSNFGSADEDADVCSLDITHQQLERPFGKNSSTSKPLKARKGVDKYPMFYLRVSLLEKQDARVHEDHYVEDEANLQTIVHVLDALITQWLSTHRFFPTTCRQQAKHNKRPKALCPSSAAHESVSPSEAPLNHCAIGNFASATKLSSGHTPQDIPKKGQPSAPASPVESFGPAPRRTFADWSRIKSGKAGFFIPSAPHPSLSEKLGVSLAVCKYDAEPGQMTRQCRSATAARFAVQSIAQGNAQPKQVLEPVIAHDKRVDGTIRWTDPSTRKTHLLSAHTGCVIPEGRLTPSGCAALSTSSTPLIDSAHSSQASSSRKRLEETPWLDTVLEAWDNPVFGTAEKRIEQLLSHDPEHDQKQRRHTQDSCYTLDADGVPFGASSKSLSKISRESLSRAEVIAQVDRKFILVKLTSSDSMEQAHAEKPVSLVLIDQHAADERVHVEALYQQLCTPIAEGCQGYKSRLGHESLVACAVLDQPVLFVLSKQERSHFLEHAARFANWGILIDVVDNAQDSERVETVLSVQALPPVILERCRADPALLISLLRSTVWEYADDSRLRPSLPFTGCTSSPDWATKLVTCPPPLLDMIHSRACRSAIMFNDELDAEQCTQLLQRLAACKFPFICAHGRPSMVPIANLNLIGRGMTHGGSEQHLDQNFMQAWRRLRN